MKKLKKIVNNITTGIRNKLRQYGSSAGNYQMAPLYLKRK